MRHYLTLFVNLVFIHIAWRKAAVNCLIRMGEQFREENDRLRAVNSELNETIQMQKSYIATLEEIVNRQLNGPAEDEI